MPSLTPSLYALRVQTISHTCDGQARAGLCHPLSAPVAQIVFHKCPSDSRLQL